MNVITYVYINNSINKYLILIMDPKNANKISIANKILYIYVFFYWFLT